MYTQKSHVAEQELFELKNRTCKDCKKGHKYKDIEECFCDYLQDDVDTDFYCKDWKRRE